MNFEYYNSVQFTARLIAHYRALELQQENPKFIKWELKREEVVNVFGQSGWLVKFLFADQYEGGKHKDSGQKGLIFE
ncbi:MAG: hypothetical protein JW776_10305 [Candidatus Lokiarchaeota archaeon]|nr:hypothetical protein [Candidatus Lokiarchaeota archaeon]